MGDIAFHIQRYRDQITRASGEIALSLKKIEELQTLCKHNWRFNRQVNNFHVHNWNVTYKCTECETERTDGNRPPVCEVCDISLVLAKKGDKEAEKERKKKKYQGNYNPPIAFRCPKCKKINILWHEGD